MEIALAILLLAGGAGGAGGGRTKAGASFTVVVLPLAARDSLNAIFAEGNRHWNELGEVNTLTQMLGTGKPTQLEYLGCLGGRVERDTLWIRNWAPARDMKRFQFAVTGDCAHLDQVVGTWHTHPYRADSLGQPIKERGLSQTDLATFAASADLIVFALWDVDSLDAAAKEPDGRVRHPAPVVVR